MQELAEEIFGSKTRALVLSEVAKATRPVNGYSLAKVSGFDIKNIYEECRRLTELGVLREVLTGKNRTGYLFSDNQRAAKLREFCLFEDKTRTDLVGRIAAALPLTEYYLSLPVSLRKTLDVFYSPNYLLLFINKAGGHLAEKVVRAVDDGKNVKIKPVSLRAREFGYDPVFKASLATDEQAIADGLNYYQEIQDREIIRALFARTSDFDLESIVKKLDPKGTERLLAILLVKMEIFKEDWKGISGELMKRKRSRLDSRFRRDLESEAIPLLLPNDEAYRENSFSSASEAISKTLNALA